MMIKGAKNKTGTVGYYAPGYNSSSLFQFLFTQNPVPPTSPAVLQAPQSAGRQRVRQICAAGVSPAFKCNRGITWSTNMEKAYNRNLPDLLTPKEAAEKLAVSRSMIYKLVKLNEISFIKIGSRIKFKPAHLEEYIQRVSVDTEAVNLVSFRERVDASC
ncbi:MAG: helix-turn-helix domain-containing protein [Fibrobacteria bacterium]|nr:helix-turn-helix domain-containing protein [Fibrobacteria bacterium]